MHHTQQIMNPEPLEPQLRPQAESEITPFPWTVESHPDSEGGYIIREVRHEQQIWCDQGYDISDDEGDWRSLIVARHEAGAEGPCAARADPRHGRRPARRLTWGPEPSHPASWI